MHYALFGREYQTGVVLRGRSKGATTPPGDEHDIPYGGFSLRGMQCFAFGDEFPILLHTDTTNSSTRADGVDTATADASWGPSGWEIVLETRSKSSLGLADLATLVTRQRSLWTLYAFTAVSAVVIYGGASGPITSRWVVNLAFVPDPSLDILTGALLFNGLKGRITYLHGEARLISEQGSLAATALGPSPCPTIVLEVQAKPPVSAFSFSDSSFRFDGDGPAAEKISFSDSSGHYILDVSKVLTGKGDIARGAQFRLKAEGRKIKNT